MADDTLNNPVEIQATHIDATLLPPNFGLSYRLYVLGQGMDLGKVAGKANESGKGAYDAQTRNDQQDIILDDHYEKLIRTENTLKGHEDRLTSAESTIAHHGQRISAAEGNIKALRTDVSYINNHYISTSSTTGQSLVSPLNVSSSYSVNGVKVIGPRQTGWTAASGPVSKGGFDAGTPFPVDDNYNKGQLEAIAHGLLEARQRIKALEDALRSHGLIDG